MSQLRATRELYSDCGDSVYLAVIDAHLRTIEDADERRRLSTERRTALLEDIKQREERKVVEEREERMHFLNMLKLPSLDSVK